MHWVLLGLYGSFRVPIEVWEVLGAVGIGWGVPMGWGERKVVVLYHPKRRCSQSGHSWETSPLSPTPGTGAMAKPGHAWSRPKSQEEEEEEDPVEAMVSRTGCAEQHWALQECMAEQRDWRRCQAQVQAFRQCMAQQQRPHPEELHPNPPHCSPNGD